MECWFWRRFASLRLAKYDSKAKGSIELKQTHVTKREVPSFTGRGTSQTARRRVCEISSARQFGEVISVQIIDDALDNRAESEDRKALADGGFRND